jgi:hypothetical protein
VVDLEVNLTETSEEVVYSANVKDVENGSINYETYSIDDEGILRPGISGTISSGKVYIPYS